MAAPRHEQTPRRGGKGKVGSRSEETEPKTNNHNKPNACPIRGNTFQRMLRPTSGSDLNKTFLLRRVLWQSQDTNDKCKEGDKGRWEVGKGKPTSHDETQDKASALEKYRTSYHPSVITSRIMRQAIHSMETHEA